MKRLWIILASITALIVLGLIVYSYLPNFVSKDCGADSTCIHEALDKCSFAKYQKTKELDKFCKPGQNFCSPEKVTIQEYVQIRGSWLGGCKVYLKWNYATGILAKWENYDANCIINPRSYNLFDLNLYCEGKLMDAYDDVYNNPGYGFVGNIAPMN